MTPSRCSSTGVLAGAHAGLEEGLRRPRSGSHACRGRHNSYKEVLTGATATRASTRRQNASRKARRRTTGSTLPQHRLCRARLPLGDVPGPALPRGQGGEGLQDLPDDEAPPDRPRNRGHRQNHGRRGHDPVLELDGREARRRDQAPLRLLRRTPPRVRSRDLLEDATPRDKELIWRYTTGTRPPGSNSRRRPRRSTTGTCA